MKFPFYPGNTDLYLTRKVTDEMQPLFYDAKQTTFTALAGLTKLLKTPILVPITYVSQNAL